MSSSPPAGSSQPARPRSRDNRRTPPDFQVEPLVVLPPTLVPLDPEEERRAVELLAELLAGLLEQPPSSKGEGSRTSGDTARSLRRGRRR